MFLASVTATSMSYIFTRDRRVDTRLEVAVAEAIKAGDDSVRALLIPRPLKRTGKLTCCSVGMSIWILTIVSSDSCMSLSIDLS